jgi:hypothetical protein
VTRADPTWAGMPPAIAGCQDDGAGS